MIKLSQPPLATTDRSEIWSGNVVTSCFFLLRYRNHWLHVAARLPTAGLPHDGLKGKTTHILILVFFFSIPVTKHLVLHILCSLQTFCRPSSEAMRAQSWLNELCETAELAALLDLLQDVTPLHPVCPLLTGPTGHRQCFPLRILIVCLERRQTDTAWCQQWRSLLKLVPKMNRYQKKSQEGNPLAAVPSTAACSWSPILGLLPKH